MFNERLQTFICIFSGMCNVAAVLDSLADAQGFFNDAQGLGLF